MLEFDYDAALSQPEPEGRACKGCGGELKFQAVCFDDYATYAWFICAACFRGANYLLTLVDVVSYNDPVGDAMAAVRDSRCIYGCGRSDIQTGPGKETSPGGSEFEVKMSCSACNGEWSEFYSGGEEVRDFN